MRTLVWVLALASLSACGSDPRVEEGRRESPDLDDAEMARDAKGELERNLEAARDKPQVITLDEVTQRVGVDATTRTKLAQPVAALNSALVRLRELHRAHDSVRVADAMHQIDQRAYSIHLEADTYENQIHDLLTDEQHRRFHAYLEERVTAVGLPLDNSHGTPGVGTAGSASSVGHPPEQGHRDTVRRSTAQPESQQRERHE